MDRRMRWTIGAVAAFVLVGAELGVTISSGPSRTTQVKQRTFRFEPVAASFVSPTRGFELGSLDCRVCSLLRATGDGGQTWRSLPAPSLYVPLATRRATSVSDVLFADTQNGWIFGPGLYVTHDGGRAWTREGLPPVAGVQAAGKYVYVLTRSHATSVPLLFRSPIASDRWTRLATPPLGTAGAQLVAAGSSLFLLRTGYQGPGIGKPGALWLSTDGGRRWTARTVPCRHEGGAAQVASVGARRWLLECFSNDQSSQEQHTSHVLYLTADDGKSWRRLAVPTSQGEPVVLGGAGRSFFLGTESGGADELVGTFDGGRTWRVRLTHGGFLGWGDLRFLSPRVGFVVGPTRAGPGFPIHDHVSRTDNGGRRWRVVDPGH